MSNKRELWLDLIRGITIICVVFEHAYESVNQYMPWESMGFDVLSEFIKTFQMAIFFAASGYLYQKREQKKIQQGEPVELKKYLYRKIMDLFVPYTVFGCLIWIGKSLFSEWVKYQVGLEDLLMMYVKPISFAWFLYALFLFEVVYALIDFFVKKNVIVSVILSLICLLVACSQVSSEMHLNKVLYYGFFYVLGILIAKYAWVHNKMQGIIATLLYIAIFITYYFNKSYVLLFAICGVLAVLAIFGLVGKMEFANKGIAKVIGFIGVQSIYIYIIHPILQHGLRAVFVKLGYMNDIAWLFVLTIVGVVVPLLYYAVSKKIWILGLPFKPRYYIQYWKERDGGK